MSPERPRPSSASTQTIKRILLGNACLFAVGLALALGPSAATAKTTKHHGGRDDVEHVKKAPFPNLPKGPLEIFVSINQQKLHFYANGEHVEDEPVATGVPGHLTPMGVFSVIERDRYHHSNIYDNAPMPFMERITWSGVALHEGVGLGHQASHGCIRMPHDFAARLWTLRTMGMRVIIARPELKPSEFADSHLFVHKDKPVAAIVPQHPVQTAQSVTPGTKIDAGDALTAHAAKDAPAATTAPTATATAPATAAPPSIAAADDAAAAAATAAAAPKPDVAAAPAAATPAQAVEPPTPANAASTPASTTPATANAAPTQPAEATKAEPATTAAAPNAPAVAPSATAPTPAARAETAAIPPANLTAPVDATPPDVPLPPAKPARLAEAGTGGPIAIFVSRKEHRIYVRQNMTPLFDAPVTIADPSQPLGTHVFTAMNYLADHSTFRWTVTSLPAETQKMVHEAKNHARGRHHEQVEYVAAASTEPPETAQQALARIDIPQDVVDQISQLIVPGSSLVVSDQGLGPETGRGTDFIVVTH